VDPKKNQLIELCWKILEYKAVYYYPHKIHKTWKKRLTIPDEKYDILENQYRALCQEFDVEPTAADMVGFDQKRPSCKLVLAKLSNPPIRKRRKK
jgi:hypothetical protein